MTGAQGPTSVAAPRERGPEAGDRSRGGPKAIQLLVPVWGTPFISQFLRGQPANLAGAGQPAGAREIAALQARFSDKLG